VASTAAAGSFAEGKAESPANHDEHGNSMLARSEERSGQNVLANFPSDDCAGCLNYEGAVVVAPPREDVFRHMAACAYSRPDVAK
jgi:hypothetical protein